MPSNCLKSRIETGEAPRTDAAWGAHDRIVESPAATDPVFVPGHRGGSSAPGTALLPAPASAPAERVAQGGETRAQNKFSIDVVDHVQSRRSDHERGHTAIERVGIELVGEGSASCTNLIYVHRVSVTRGRGDDQDWTFDTAASIWTTQGTNGPVGKMWLNRYAADTNVSGAAIEWLGA